MNANTVEGDMTDPPPGNKGALGPLRDQEEVRKALAYADDIMATLREPFLVLDSNLRVKTANRSFCDSFHVSKNETENQLVYQLGDGQWDIAGLRKVLDEVLTRHHPVNDFEVEHDFPAIGRRLMLLNARQFPPEAVNPELILLAIEDVTERRKAETALRDKSELQYRRLFEAAKDGILILDADTDAMTVLDANPFMAELLGYSHDEFLGRELWEIGFFCDKEESKAAYRELHEQGYIRYEHPPLKKKNGEKAEVEFICNTYLMGDKKVAQCNIRDISERFRLEKKTQEQAEALANLSRRKDEFLAMLGHELRNPLAPIANAAQLLRLVPNEGPVQKQARAIIERQVAALTRLVDDLLEVARITTGRVQLRQEPVAMGSIVERAVETTRPLIDQHKHELTQSLPPEPIWLSADPARLEQVVVNLLTNAAKYTLDGGHIFLSVMQEGDECVLRVRDTGVGIAPELLPHIFDVFTQAERSLDRSEGGLGIGLAVVQRMVQLHQGRVEAHSSTGKGSEFVVRLPVLQTPVPEPTVTEPMKPAVTSLRILLVDDNMDAATSLADLLVLFGHDTRTAHDGFSALETAIDYQPDVVLLDIGLPKLNGYEVAKRIRQQATLKDVVLVAVTGYGLETDHERSKEAGFNHHLVKPADFGKLQEILATVKAP